MRLAINLNLSKKTFVPILAIVLIVAGAAIWYVRRPDTNPLPANIKSQLSYKVVYPAQVSQIAPASYDYQPTSKTLSFNISYAGATVVFTEQPAPDSLGANGQVYYPAIGLRPYAQFETALGPVALAKFWQSGNLKAVGESAVLDSHGTLLIAHASQDLTNAQWKSLLESLKVTP